MHLFEMLAAEQILNYYRDLYTKIKINLPFDLMPKTDILGIKKIKLNGPLIHFYFN